MNLDREQLKMIRDALYIYHKEFLIVNRAGDDLDFEEKIIETRNMINIELETINNKNNL